MTRSKFEPQRFALHPDGAVRTALSVPDTDALGVDIFWQLSAGAARSDLGDDGLYLAEELLATETFLTDAQRRALAHAVLALLTATSQGATRLSLNPRGELRELISQIARPIGTRVTAEEIAKVAAELSHGHFARIIGRPGQRRPLIVEDNFLYLHRDHQREGRTAQAIASLLSNTSPSLPSAAKVAVAIKQLAQAPAGVALSDEQLAAVQATLGQRLSVIVGGPGTGKTALAVAVVRGLARTGATTIALCAPTGRAAHRLGSSVAAALARLADGKKKVAAIDQQLAAEPPTAVTLHRLLGAYPSGFRHGAHAPLHVDAVLVDEASMMDLRLADALIAALGPNTRLVLLGDADQLPPVEAGQVLADLVVFGKSLDGAPWLSQLTHSFRMDSSDPNGAAVLNAANAVRAGDTASLLTNKTPLLAVSDDLTSPPRGATWVEQNDAQGRDQVLAGLFARFATPQYLADATAEHEFDGDGNGFNPAARAAIGRLLATFETSRLLTATRGLPTGAIALNEDLHERLARPTVTTDRQHEFIPGEPVMMTANDHARGLYNGDPGVVVRVVEPGIEQRWRAVFSRGGKLIPMPLDALRGQLERAWAITVHKSQGAEFDDVTLVLPEEDAPISTRELLYTAMTRARKGVRVVGSKVVIAAAVGRPAMRSSGLAAKILLAGKS